MKRRKLSKWFYTITSLLSLVVITIIFYKYSEPQRITYNPNVSFISSVSYNPTEEFVPIDPVQDGINILKLQQKQVLEQKERQAKIDRIESLLTRFNSPFQGYGELIYNRAEECGGDYKVLIGIAGNESGLGRVPYKLYNPFGYLDGKQYSGWDESLTFLSCVISQRFIKPCNSDLVCIINKYGGPGDDKDLWIRNVSYFISQL